MYSTREVKWVQAKEVGEVMVQSDARYEIDNWDIPIDNPPFSRAWVDSRQNKSPMLGIRVIE